jgi:hypothetical protein
MWYIITSLTFVSSYHHLWCFNIDFSFIIFFTEFKHTFYVDNLISHKKTKENVYKCNILQNQMNGKYWFQCKKKGDTLYLIIKNKFKIFSIRHIINNIYYKTCKKRLNNGQNWWQLFFNACLMNTCNLTTYAIILILNNFCHLFIKYKGN